MRRIKNVSAQSYWFQLRVEGTQHLAGGSCNIRRSGPYAEGNLSLIALNYKWCHFRGSSAECQMRYTLGLLSQTSMHQRAFAQVRRFGGVCRARGGRSPPPCLPVQNCTANKLIFSTMSPFEGTWTGCGDFLPYERSQKCFLSLTF